MSLYERMSEPKRKDLNRAEKSKKRNISAETIFS